MLLNLFHLQGYRYNKCLKRTLRQLFDRTNDRWFDTYARVSVLTFSDFVVANLRWTCCQGTISPLGATTGQTSHEWRETKHPTQCNNNELAIRPIITITIKIILSRNPSFLSLSVFRIGFHLWNEHMSSGRLNPTN